MPYAHFSYYLTPSLYTYPGLGWYLDTPGIWLTPLSDPLPLITQTHLPDWTFSLTVSDSLHHLPHPCKCIHSFNYHHVNIELFSLLYLSTRNYPWYILFATCVRSHLVLGMINLNFVPFRHHCTFVLLSFCHLCRFSLIFWTPDSWSNRQHPCHLQSTVMVIMKRCCL